MSRSNQSTNVNFSSKIISIFVSSQECNQRAKSTPSISNVVPRCITVIMSAEDMECLFGPCKGQGE